MLFVIFSDIQMNCALFATMDLSFSLKNTTLENTGKMEINTGKVREFCYYGIVGTMLKTY